MAATKPIVVGIAGGSGSGKTTLSRALVSALGAHNVTYICHDYYYHDLSHLPKEERANTNFDHPDALETSLLVEQLRALKSGGAVDVPTYDFAAHTRARETTRAEGKGESDIRFIRRMRRDVAERNRTAEDVAAQFLSTVKPMHDLFVTPSKKFCDLVVPDGMNPVVLDMMVARLRPHAGLLAAADARAEDA